MASSSSNSVSGIQASAARMAVRAHNVANINTNGFKGSSAVQADKNPGTRVASIRKTGEDTAADLTSIKTIKHSHTANLAILKKMDEMLGELIDLKG